MGTVWAPLGPFWAPLGPFWIPLGPFWAPGPSFGYSVDVFWGAPVAVGDDMLTGAAILGICGPSIGKKKKMEKEKEKEKKKKKEEKKQKQQQKKLEKKRKKTQKGEATSKLRRNMYIYKYTYASMYAGISKCRLKKASVQFCRMRPVQPHASSWHSMALIHL